MPIFEYIRSKFLPICHISHSSSTAIHLLLLQISLLLPVLQFSTILIFKLILIILTSHFKLLQSYKFKLQQYLQRGKVDMKKERKLLSYNPIYLMITMMDMMNMMNMMNMMMQHLMCLMCLSCLHLLTTSPESHVEPPAKKSKKMRQLTAEKPISCIARQLLI